MKKIWIASVILALTGSIGHGIAYADKFEQAQACECEVNKNLKFAEWKIELAKVQAENLKVGGPVSDLARALQVVRAEAIQKQLDEIRSVAHTNCWK